MTPVLIGKGLVLGGWPSKMEVIWVPGIYIYTCEHVCSHCAPLGWKKRHFSVSQVLNHIPFRYIILVPTFSFLQLWCICVVYLMCHSENSAAQSVHPWISGPVWPHQWWRSALVYPPMDAGWAYYYSYKWSYNPYKWPYKWVTGVISPL